MSAVGLTETPVGTWSRVFTARCNWLCTGCDERIRLSDPIQGRVRPEDRKTEYRHMWCNTETGDSDA